MVIDTSALIAILQEEPEARVFADAIAADPKRLLSTVSSLEAALVIEARYGPHGGRELDLLLHSCRIEAVPFTDDQAAIAREGWRKFGKGHHEAGLNMGDCCAYALAKSTGEPLLCKGQDFLHTDIPTVPLQ